MFDNLPERSSKNSSVRSTSSRERSRSSVSVEILYTYNYSFANCYADKFLTGLLSIEKIKLNCNCRVQHRIHNLCESAILEARLWKSTGL